MMAIDIVGHINDSYAHQKIAVEEFRLYNSMSVIFGGKNTVDVLDLELIDARLVGFFGSVVDGRYLYCIPYGGWGRYGNIARVNLNDFSTVTVLNLRITDPDLRGFYGGVTDGHYLYCIPYYNGTTESGKIARVDLDDFTTVTALDLTDTDPDLKCFRGGATDGRYLYCIPYSGAGKIARVDLSDFTTVAVLDLAVIDVELSYFKGGVIDGRYLYCIPGYYNYSKIARVDLDDFSTVTVLDLTDTDADLKGFWGGTTDGRYLYCIPFRNSGPPPYWSGKIARVDLSDFTTVTVLDLTVTDADLEGFRGGVTDGEFLYCFPGSANGKLPRVDLSDFTTVTVLDLAAIDSDLGNRSCGVIDGYYLYCMPASFWIGKVVRVAIRNYGNKL